MTKVVYTYTAPDGYTIKTKYKTLAEVIALVESRGGHYKAEYIPISRPALEMTPKRKRSYALKYGAVYA